VTVGHLVDIVDKLVKLLGTEAVLLPDQVAERASSFWDASPMQAKALLRPKTTQEVSDALKLCHATGQTVITHGGLSGCVEGAVTNRDHIVISLERMNAIEEIDKVGSTATIQAGAVLQTVQEKIADAGLYFPLDLGARGSCTIGGNIATNAGGINVIRYGMMRNLVLGLEAVLADGTIISCMNKMLKNNSGYDLKQLFIGSEGTLGIVTRVIVKLELAHKSQSTALIALEDFSKVTEVLSLMKSKMGSTLSAYEVMWKNYYRAVTAEGWHKSPMSRDFSFYVVVECDGTDPDRDGEQFTGVLETALGKELILDAILPQSDREREDVWNIREDFEAITVQKPYYLYDVSLPIKYMHTYIEEVQNSMSAEWPNGACYVLGHIGDGNLHLFVVPRQGDKDLHGRSDELVYTPLTKYAGSVSAEHGIGIEKKAWLNICRSEAEIALMKQFKNSLDPKGILNPGLIFD